MSEGAGCSDPDILGHCRGPGPHAGGCRVVGLLLRKAGAGDGPTGDQPASAPVILTRPRPSRWPLPGPTDLEGPPPRNYPPFTITSDPEGVRQPSLETATVLGAVKARCAGAIPKNTFHLPEGHRSL